jgi:hypothetical protein
VEASVVMKRQTLAKVNPPRCQKRQFHPADDDLRFLDNL